MGDVPRVCWLSDKAPDVPAILSAHSVDESLRDLWFPPRIDLMRISFRSSLIKVPLLAYAVPPRFIGDSISPRET